MNKEDTLLSLRSFMEMAATRCKVEGRPFDVADAIEAASPIVESLLYTISSKSGLPKKVKMDPLTEIMAEADSLIDHNGDVKPSHETDAACALANLVQAWREAEEDEGEDEDDDACDHDWDSLPGPVTCSKCGATAKNVPTRTVDDVFGKLFGKP